jgi:hypothetical protein
MENFLNLPYFQISFQNIFLARHIEKGIFYEYMDINSDIYSKDGDVFQLNKA